jgi:ubiquinone/menaquinone biosynthesis C-methylase UbiE
MIPFQIHRRIPFLRRPFYQRDEAIRERDALRLERNALRSERDALRAERDALRNEREEFLNNFPVGSDSATPRILINRSGSRLEMRPEALGSFDFAAGDEVWITPASKVRKTPDGHFHIAVGDRRYRIPPKIVLTLHKEYLFPEHLVALTGAGTETLEPFGRAHIAAYQKFVGLHPKMTILEIGSGIGRDALQFVEILGQEGRFIGTDVTWDSVEWCQKNISTRYKNFQFHHFDAAHELYNPLGRMSSLDFSLPAADRSVDRVCAGSVFTHLFEEEVVHYMREIARVLKSDGLAYATFFLYSDETISSARKTNLTHNNLMFLHPYADGCFVNDPNYPTGAVAFTDAAMRRMISRAGLRLVRPYLKGAWSGAHQEPDDGQEVAILGI